MDFTKDHKNKVNSLLMEKWGYGKMDEAIEGHDGKPCSEVHPDVTHLEYMNKLDEAKFVSKDYEDPDKLANPTIAGYAPSTAPTAAMVSEEELTAALGEAAGMPANLAPNYKPPTTKPGDKNKSPAATGALVGVNVGGNLDADGNPIDSASKLMPDGGPLVTGDYGFGETGDPEGGMSGKDYIYKDNPNFVASHHPDFDSSEFEFGKKGADVRGLGTYYKKDWSSQQGDRLARAAAAKKAGSAVVKPVEGPITQGPKKSFKNTPGVSEALKQMVREELKNALKNKK